MSGSDAERTGTTPNKTTTTMTLSFYREPIVREYRPQPGFLTSKLEEFICSQRLRLQRLWQKYQSARQSVNMKYETARAHSDSVADYLRSEPVFLERAAIISVAAITGLVISYRKTAMRKAGYALAFGGAATAVCYPYQTIHYTSSAYNAVKTNAPWNDYNLSYIPGWKSKTTSTVEDEEVKETVLISASEEDMGQSTPEDKDMYSTREG